MLGGKAANDNAEPTSSGPQSAAVPQTLEGQVANENVEPQVIVRDATTGLPIETASPTQSPAPVFNMAGDGKKPSTRLVMLPGGKATSNSTPKGGAASSLVSAPKSPPSKASRAKPTEKRPASSPEPEESNLVLSESELLGQTGMSEGKPIEFRLAEAGIGNEFNATQNTKYPYSEVPIRDATGKVRRADSYKPDPVNPKNGEIVSRKSLELSNGQIAFVDTDTMIGHFQEFRLKYRSGATIADTPAARKMGLAGQKMEGQYIFEVPVQRYEIPDIIIQEATKRGIIIRDSEGKRYN